VTGEATGTKEGERGKKKRVKIKLKQGRENRSKNSVDGLPEVFQTKKREKGEKLKGEGGGE